MLLSVPAFAARLREACAEKNAAFRIVYHINPDGDCIGSGYALAMILRALGAKAAVTGRDPVPAQFRDMTDSLPNDNLPDGALYIGVDGKDRSRTGQTLQEMPYAFWIDHHGSTETQAPNELVLPERSACGEIVLELAEALGVPVTPQMAELLYTALVTDTNCFRTVSTNAVSFRSAARLTEYGADAYGIARRYAMVKSPARLAIERTVFGKMHTLCGGRLVSSEILLSDLADAGIAEQNAPELQNINGLLEVIGSAEMTVMVREYPEGTPEGRTRFSVKTTSAKLSARDIAEQMGNGSGHPQAAGGFSDLTPGEARAKLEALCAKALEAAE